MFKVKEKNLKYLLLKLDGVSILFFCCQSCNYCYDKFVKRWEICEKKKLTSEDVLTDAEIMFEISTVSAFSIMCKSDGLDGIYFDEYIFFNSLIYHYLIKYYL